MPRTITGRGTMCRRRRLLWFWFVAPAAAMWAVVWWACVVGVLSRRGDSSIVLRSQPPAEPIPGDVGPGSVLAAAGSILHVLEEGRTCGGAGFGGI